MVAVWVPARGRVLVVMPDPTVFASYPVMETAETATIFHAGGSTVQPPDDVVDVAPAGRPVAAGEDASAVPQGHGAADPGGPGAGGPADVQRLGGGPEDGGDQVAVAQQSAGGGRTDGDAGGVQGGRSQPAGEGVVSDGHGDVWAFAALHGSGAGGQVVGQHGGQRLRQPGARGAGVLHPVGFRSGFGVRVGGGDEHGDRVVVEFASDRGESGAGVPAAQGEFGAVGGVAGVVVAVRVQGVDQFLGDQSEVSGVHLLGVADQGGFGVFAEPDRGVGGDPVHGFDDDRGVLGAEGAGAQGVAECG